VHAACLYTWQLTQLAASASSGGSRDRHLSCGVCGVPFRGVTPPDIVGMVESLVGAEVVSLLGLQSLLVATRSSSERVVPAMSRQMFFMLLNLKRAHWKYSVYFIYKYDREDSTHGVIRALNLTRLMDNSSEKPIPDEILFARAEYPWMHILHFNGGPVKWGSLRTGLVLLGVGIGAGALAAAEEGEEDELIILPRTETSTIIIAKFSVLARYLKEHYSAAYTEGSPLTVYTFSGYAQWNRLQLLGEINKGSWGVVDPALLPEEEHCFHVPVARSSSSSSSSNIEGGNLWPSFHPRAICAGGRPEGTPVSVSAPAPAAAGDGDRDNTPAEADGGGDE
jgi:hypothetical protein